MRTEARRKYEKEWRANNREKMRGYFKKWYDKNGISNYQKHISQKRANGRKYNNSPKGVLKPLKYPEKVKARVLLRYSVKQGLIQKLPCEVCGNKKSQGHHSDYSKPLIVQWLCSMHHAQVHKS